MYQESNDLTEEEQLVWDLLRQKSLTRLLDESHAQASATKELSLELFSIANKIVCLPQFRSYPLKEEMVNEVYLRMVSVWPKAPRTNLAFAYFTQVGFMAVHRFLEKEKSQLNIKNSLSADIH